MVSDFTDKALFNPLQTQFTHEWFDDLNASHTLTIPAQDIAYFPPNQYEFMKRHLRDAVMHERNVAGYNEEKVEEIIKEITL